MTISGCACGCCEGVHATTGQGLVNRPGLDAVRYRVGTHPDFFASMVAALTSERRPALSRLTTRDPDDWSIAVLDAWAVVADVLTFYSERLANESYLRTAGERASLQELARLIGYQLRPGVAARADLAFALEHPAALPPAPSQEPGSAPAVMPAVVALDPGVRVQSIPGPGEAPQTFETIEPVEARPEWNAIAVATTAPGLGPTTASLGGDQVQLKVGDVLLFTGPLLSSGFAVRTLKAVRPQVGLGRTEVEWSEDLVWPAGPSPTVQVLRKRLSVFGSSAPDVGLLHKAFPTGYPEADATTHDWPGLALSGAGGNKLDLDGSHPDVTVGSPVVILQSGAAWWGTVQSVVEASRAAFGISGRITTIELDAGAGPSPFAGSPRTTTVLAVAEEFPVVERTDTSLVQGSAIDVAGDVLDMAPGRRLVVQSVDHDGLPRTEVVTVATVGGTRARGTITLTADLSGTYQRPSTVVLGNVAAATHGESVHQLLGSGQAKATSQRFVLAHAPLTQLPTADGAGVAPALEVRVNDVAWTAVPTLAGAGPTERAFVVGTDEQGRTYVQFGDGVRGSRLPTGIGNVRARYRVGLGAAGNVRAGSLSQLLVRPLGLKGVANPSVASDGVDPEPEAAARATMPLTVRTLGRTVSLLDYEDFARAFAGVAAASASVLQLRGGRTIVVTVALEEGGSADRLAVLAGSLQSHGDPQVRIEVLPPQDRTFRLAGRVTIDPDREAPVVHDAVRSALGAAFSIAARAFGDPVHRSQVIGAIHTVPGVRGVDLDQLSCSGDPVGLSDRLLAPRAAVTASGTAAPAGRLSLDVASLADLVVSA